MSRTRNLALCGVLTALYAALTIATPALSYGPLQLRLAEALCLLPVLLPQTVWGLALGCFAANLFSTVTALDAVIGTLATLLAGLWIRRCRRLWLTPLPLALCNGALVGAMLAWFYTPGQFFSGFALFFAQVAAGELIVGYGLGLPLLLLLKKSRLPERYQ